MSINQFTRGNPLFSLCGLNCGLCPMRLGGHCGGCGFGNQSCPLARCSMEHGGVEYCFQCNEYPCGRYDDIDVYDSFITHRGRKADLQKAQQIGIEAYNAEQEQKIKILENLLDRYNDGRKKTMFCIAVNLLELNELTAIMEQAELNTQGMSLKDASALVSSLFQQCAAAKGIELKLRKKRRTAT